MRGGKRLEMEFALFGLLFFMDWKISLKTIVDMVQQLLITVNTLE